MGWSFDERPLMELDHQLAAAVVSRAMDDVGFNLNLMDETGTIIASGDPARIGTVHRGAVDALRAGEPIETTVATATEREGINLPIAHEGALVGVVGITGPLAEVRPLARLVRSTVELLLVQAEIVARRTRTASRAELLAATLIHREEPCDADLIARAREFGLNLTGQVVVLALRDEPPTEHRQPLTTAGGFILRADLVLCGSADLPAVRRRLDHLTSHASEPGRSVARAVLGAESTRRVATSLGLRGNRDEAALAAVRALEGLEPPTVCAALKTHPELAATLRAWIGNDLAPAATAAELVMHRNTLTYRLNRITQLTGLDPRRVPDLITLAGCLLHEGA